jgi:hypothetical protein
VNTPIAIIIASAIIGASIVGATVATFYLWDRYELATTGGDTALGWRLNRRTGAVVVCELAKNPAIPKGTNMFADMPEVAGSRDRPVDKVVVQCGYE